jgi:hypothetical protein
MASNLDLSPAFLSSEGSKTQVHCREPPGDALCTGHWPPSIASSGVPRILMHPSQSSSLAT